MDQFTVRVVGHEFDAADCETKYTRTDEAEAAALKAAVAIAAEDVVHRQQSTVLEARVEHGSKVVSRLIVAVSVEHLPPA